MIRLVSRMGRRTTRTQPAVAVTRQADNATEQLVRRGIDGNANPPGLAPYQAATCAAVGTSDPYTARLAFQSTSVLIADSARPMNQVGQAAGSRRSFIIVRVIGYRMGRGRLSPG